MKSLVLFAMLIIAPSVIFAQKKTHDHEKFVKKIVFSLTPQLLVKWVPDDAAIKYVSDRGGSPIEELKKEVEAMTENLKEDAQFLIDNGIYIKYDKITVNVKQSEPYKIADIVIHCEFKGDVYDVTLHNCVQTDQSWYLGDAIRATGEGVKDAIAKQEARKNKGNGGLLGKLNDLAEESGQEEPQENDNTNIKIYEATRFPMRGTDASSQFIKHELIGQTLDGYYLDQNYNKVEAKIKYQAPEIMSDPNKYLMVMDNNSKGMSKNGLKAFFVGGQMYVFTGEYWDILVKEGAIRRLARVVKNESTGNYVLGELVQKLDLGPENTASLGLGFKNKMADLVKDNSEIADKVSSKAEGYRFKDLEKIADEYNAWYNQKYPGQVVYLLEKMKGDNSEEIAEVEESASTDYSSWSDIEIEKEFEIAIRKGMSGIVLEMMKSDPRVSANHGTIGNKSPLLVAVESNQFRLARILISEGADVQATDGSGLNALHFLMFPIDELDDNDKIYDTDLAKVLIEKGLDVNAQDKSGNTALHYAAMERNYSVLEHFIKTFNPDKSIKNVDGATAFVLAGGSGDPSLSELLKP